MVLVHTYLAPIQRERELYTRALRIAIPIGAGCSPQFEPVYRWLDLPSTQHRLDNPLQDKMHDVNSKRIREVDGVQRH